MRLFNLWVGHTCYHEMRVLAMLVKSDCPNRTCSYEYACTKTTLFETKQTVCTVFANKLKFHEKKSLLFTKVLFP